MSDPPFLALAPELKQGIFLQLADVSSLHSVILTCSSFRCTFLNAESLILNTILEKRTHPSAAFDALAVHEASKLGPTNETWSKKAVQLIMSLYDDNRSALWSHVWCLREALEFERLNDIVHYLTNEFISSALSVKPVGIGPDSQATSCQAGSFAEVGRIQRTIYRYELYCNLFRMRKPVTSRGVRGQLLPVEPVDGFRAQEKHDTFFAKFTAWENEQLACVRDFLMARISIPFNDVARHDVEWGEREVNYLDDEQWAGGRDKEEHLMLGLAYLHRVVTASTDEARYDAIDTAPNFDPLSLHKGLSYRPYQSHLGSLPFTQWPELEREQILDESHACDFDNGPKRAWLWAHEDSYRLYCNDEIYDRQVYLRQHGYVMWGLCRWECWGLSRMAFEEWEDLCNESPVPTPTEGEKAEMQYSFKARSRIYNAGGRGWWAPGDESRIVWPGVKAPDGWLSEEEWWKGRLVAEAKAHEERRKQERRKLRGLSSLEELLRAHEKNEALISRSNRNPRPIF